MKLKPHTRRTSANPRQTSPLPQIIAGLLGLSPLAGHGAVNFNSSACGGPATLISAVQGQGASTPLAGVANTTIEGIVVGDYQGTAANSLRGFFVQEEAADMDGNPATSEGIFVFDGTNGNPDVRVGDRVRVTGTPMEFFNMTQMSALTAVRVCSTGNPLPAPIALTLPVPDVPNGDLAAATSAINAYYERNEGMLVRFPITLRIAEYFQLERFGQLVLNQGGRIPTFTNASNPSVSGWVNHQIQLARRRIILDDKDNTQNAALTNNRALFYPTDGAGGMADGLSISNRFRGGDTITGLTGVLHWSFAGAAGTDAWRIRPVDEVYDYVFAPANLRPAAPPQVDGTLKVAAFNIWNYFTTIDTTASTSSGHCGPNGTQECRGADSVAELNRQSAKLATAICGLDADIVGLNELENNATDSALQALVNASNAACGAGTFDYVPTGVIGGDAIKVGFIYKPAKVSLVGATAVLDSPAFVNGGDSVPRNRPALAQSFEQTSTGERLTVVVNHLKSKGSPCDTPDAGDGQGNCNQVRTNAARQLLSWLATHPTGVNDPDYLIIGDLNSYANEDPIRVIERGANGVAGGGDDYTNLIRMFSGQSAYSFVFDGQSGYLDHALASASLLSKVSGAGEWHINADEPPSFDYNDSVRDTGEASFEVKPSATVLYNTDPYRTSDHDPLIVGLDLAGHFNIINGRSGQDRLVGTAGNDRITGFGGADTLTGGGGNDVFVYTSTVDGTDTITDFAIGSDRIDLSALLLTIGYQRHNPIADGIVSFSRSGANVVVSIDPDGTGPATRRSLLVVRNTTPTALAQAGNFRF